MWSLWYINSILMQRYPEILLQLVPSGYIRRIYVWQMLAIGGTNFGIKTIYMYISYRTELPDYPLVLSVSILARHKAGGSINRQLLALWHNAFVNVSCRRSFLCHRLWTTQVEPWGVDCDIFGNRESWWHATLFTEFISIHRRIDSNYRS